MPDRKHEVVTRAEQLAITSFRQRTDHTYHRLVDLSLREANARRSLFIGVLIEKCFFEDVDFARSDFSGSKIVRSRFRRCRFRLTELRSCEFIDCTFEECDFSLSHWLGTKSTKTCFIAADLQQATVTECNFQDCQIAGVLFKSASVTSSSFESCKFERTGFSDCTAMFLFLEKCSFDQFAMNAESIGFTFGLSSRDLPDIGLIYLGKRQNKPSEHDLISILATTYTSRRWFVGSAAIDINFDRRPTVIVLKQLSEELRWLQDQNLPFDKAELRFLLEILGRLQSSDCLPLLGVWYIGRSLQAASPSANDDLAALITRFNRIFSVALDQAISRHLPAKRGRYLLTISFKSRPKLPLDVLVAGVLIDGELEFVKGYEGSWIEVWEASHNAVFTIDLLLIMTLGVSRSLEEAVRGFRSMMAAVRRPARPRVQRMTSQTDLEVLDQVVLTVTREGFPNRR